MVFSRLGWFSSFSGYSALLGYSVFMSLVRFGDVGACDCCMLFLLIIFYKYSHPARLASPSNGVGLMFGLGRTKTVACKISMKKGPFVAPSIVNFRNHSKLGLSGSFRVRGARFAAGGRA